MVDLGKASLSIVFVALRVKPLDVIMLRKGDRVKWLYWRQCGYSTWVATKFGTFIGFCPRKPGYGQVLFPGNKNVSRVPLNELESV